MAYFNLNSVLGMLGKGGLTNYTPLKPQPTTTTAPNINVQPYVKPTEVDPVQNQPTTPKPGEPRPPIQQFQQPLVPPNPFVGPNVHPTAPPEPGNADAQRGISDELLKQLMSFIGNPSRYNQDIVDSRFAHQREVLGKGYDAQAGKINEDLAKRGLFYSTEVGGRMGDLRGQQAQAEAGLLSDLTTDQARTHAEDMQRAINTILGFGSQQFSQQQATAQMNMLQDEQMRNFLLQLLGGTS